MTELWERIEEAAARVATTPGAAPSSLLGVVGDLADRGSSLARAWIDEALAASRMGEPVASAIRADLLARLGDRDAYQSIVAGLQPKMKAADAETRATLAGHLAAGAETLGLVEEAAELIANGGDPAWNARRAADRRDGERAEALMRSPAFKKLHWTTRVQTTVAVARALARTGEASRVLSLLATAETAARRAKQEQLRWPPLVSIAVAFSRAGAVEDARRLAREADRALLDRSDPCGAIEYIDIAEILHRAGETGRAREIATAAETSDLGRRNPTFPARLWAAIDDEGRARRLLGPLEAAAQRGEIRDGAELGAIARIHLALGDVAAAIRRAGSASVDHRVRALRDIAAYCHEHGVLETPEIAEALAEVST